MNYDLLLLLTFVPMLLAMANSMRSKGVDLFADVSNKEENN